MNNNNDGKKPKYGLVVAYHTAYKSNRGKFTNQKILIITGNTFEEFQANVTAFFTDQPVDYKFYYVTPYGVYGVDDINDFWCEERACGNQTAGPLWWEPNQEGTVSIATVVNNTNSLENIIPLLSENKPELLTLPSRW